ncbi:hypothetical protein PIB30_046562 [Stylosanthes scabra]|uniref:Uncharacterized protein n=1 Tax=Stylosanthes scabra TaxID=79078 RepID=A0ABU6VFJ8_9FABA|nr:hypothetical protein [Stylosanthes scabra]
MRPNLQGSKNWTGQSNRLNNEPVLTMIGLDTEIGNLKIAFEPANRTVGPKRDQAGFLKNLDPTSPSLLTHQNFRGQPPTTPPFVLAGLVLAGLVLAGLVLADLVLADLVLADRTRLSRRRSHLQTSRVLMFFDRLDSHCKI